MRCHVLLATWILTSVTGAVAQDAANDGGPPIAAGPASVAPAGGTTQTIRFETFPGGAPVPGGAEITNQYASLGVIFSSANCAPGATQVTNILDFVSTPSPRNCLAPCGPAPFNGGTLVMRFDPPVTRVSALHVDDQLPVVWKAFNANGVEVDTASSDGSNVGFDRVTVSGDGIVRVEAAGGFFGRDQPDGWAIDDLEYDQLDDDPPCPLERALIQVDDLIGAGVNLLAVLKSPDALQVVRDFRDNVLKQTDRGQEIVQLYYDHSDEVKRLMAADPQLAIDSLNVVLEALPQIRAAARSQTEFRISKATLEKGIGLLNRFETHASTSLRRAIADVRSDLRNGTQAHGDMVVLSFVGTPSGVQPTASRPSPLTWALVGVGLIGLVGLRRRRQ